MADGMNETQSVLNGINILWGGAGNNDVEARRVTHLSYGGKSISVIAMSNRTGHYNNYQPFLDAGRNRPGFALWNRTAIETQIPPAVESSDIVMLQVHCGSEYSRYPRDGDNELPVRYEEVPPDEEYIIFEMVPDSGEVALRHYAVDMGADLVICHHPHIIHGVEIYNGKLIAHSLGNFLFDLSMNETMPSMLLEIHVGADSVDAAIVRPMYIFDWVPVPATGGLGRAILDYLTHYSRLLDTYLIRMPGEDVATVFWDTTLTRYAETSVDTFQFAQSGGYYQTRPFRMYGEGYISQLEFDEATDIQVRWGRDILLWANMENEGAQPWDLNSNYEFYDDSYSHEGSQSIQLSVPSNAGDNYVTLFRRRVQIDPAFAYSVLGWMRTEASNDAEFQVRFFDQRSEGNQLAQDIPLSLDGDNPWTPAYNDYYDLPNNYRYINVRLSDYPSSANVSRAWYDELAFIEWQEWQDVNFSNQIELPYPSGYRFAQVRSTEQGSGRVVVTWTREWPFEPPAWNGIVEEEAIPVEPFHRID